MGADKTVNGTVVELLESGKVRVELGNRRRVLAHAGAASRVNFVRLRPGDQVAVALSQSDGTRGRIVRRLEGRQEKEPRP
jgi:translation initiation factor IF-1